MISDLFKIVNLLSIIWIHHVHEKKKNNSFEKVKQWHSAIIRLNMVHWLVY